MENVLIKLQARRKVMFIILLVASVLALSVDYFFDIQPVNYFEYETQMLMVYALILYKLIELVIIYFVFYYRHLQKSRKAKDDNHVLTRFEKNGKRFFMLVPQGNIVFGIIAYKLTGIVGFLFLFLLFALGTLLLINPLKAMNGRNSGAGEKA